MMQIRPQHLIPLSLPVSDNLAAPNTGVFSWIEPALPSETLDTSLLNRGLTLVLCTYKRPASLKQFLDSLATQNHLPDQLIIVDSSPADDTEQMLRSYQD